MKAGRKWLSAERVVQFLVGVALGVLLWVIAVGLLTWTWLPSEVAFLLGLGGFYLLGNRLVFGYGALARFLDEVAGGRDTAQSREQALERSGVKGLEPEALGAIGISLVWLERLEHYRYPFFGLFMLLLILTLLAKFSPLGLVALGNYLEGAFWGAAVVCFFVMVLDGFCRWVLGELVRAAEAEAKAN